MNTRRDFVVGGACAAGAALAGCRTGRSAAPALAGIRHFAAAKRKHFHV